MATTKVINDLIDLNQSGSTSGLKGCAGTTAQRPTESFDIEYLIVGGGGTASGSGSGGGGAGGLITGTTTVASGVSETLQIGAGATADPTLTNTQPNGGDTVFSSFTADGGGSGQRRLDGTSGGSGGGGGVFSNSSSFVGGSATSGQGNDGGDSSTSFKWATGGGGGSGNPLADTNGVGASSSANQSGNGGSGTNMTSFISVSDATSAVVGEIVSGTNVFFAGGGGGGGGDDSGGAIGTSGNVIGGTGGSGGGGTGSQTAGVRGTSALEGSGGGGGGGVTGSSDSAGGDGGSGVAIFKYDNTKVTGATVDGTLVAPSTTAPTTSTCNYPTGAGCQALYQFNSNINDTCGNYNGVSSSNITYAAGQYGNAAQLNGSSSNIFLPDNSNFDLTASQSISLWLNSNNAGNAWLLHKGNPESYGIWTNGSILYFTLYNPSYSQLTTSSITLNTWYHVVLTVDSAGTGCILYLNGAVADSNTFGAAVNTNTGDVRIGSYQGGSLFWNGAIDQLRYFNTTLSSAQVTELYNEVAYQTKFTNGTTDTIVFKEGSGNITFQKTDTDPGAEIGMLRCNTTLGQMEHYTSSGYKTFTNL